MTKLKRWLSTLLIVCILVGSFPAQAAGESSAPNLTAILNSNDKPVLTWTAMDGAEQYEVWRAAEDGKYTKLWTGTGRKLTNTSAVAGTTYSYKVRAVVGGIFYSAYSNIVSITVPSPLTAPAVTVTLNDNQKPVITWNAVKGAEQYEVWRAVGSGEYTLLKTMTGRKLTNTSAVAGNTYSYKVRAVAGKIYSEYSDAVSIKTPATLTAPMVTVILNDNDKPVITWNAVKGAEQYEVWRAVGSGEYTLLKTMTGRKLTNTSAAAGNTYSYKVRAVAGTRYSAYSAVETITVPSKIGTPTLSVSNKENTGKVVLSWTRITGAEKYEIWFSTSKTGTYKKLWTGSSTQVNHSSGTAGVTYYYKVRAVSNGDYGEFSAVKLRACDLAQPVITVGNNASTGKVVISWEAVDGAAKYEVYRATGKNGTYTLLKTMTGTKLTNTSAEPGVTYYYKVRAIHSTNSSAASAYSIAKSRTCDCAAPVVTIAQSNNGAPVLSWNQVDGAVRYEVYRSTRRSDGFTLLWTGTSTKVTYAPAVAGTTYYYKVKAISSDINGNSAFSNIVSTSEIASSSLAGTYDITMWVSELAGVVELTQQQIDAFEAANPGIVINASIEGVTEADAGSKVVADVASAPDIYCFAQDQLVRLVQAAALAAPGKNAAETIKTANDAGSVAAGSVAGTLYAYPMTSDNGYYMYYDTSIISEEDAESLESIIAACEANGVKFRYALENAWYTVSFFFATGCHSNWTMNEAGEFTAVDDNFNSEAGLIAMKGMEKLAKSPAYDSNADIFTDAGAIITGIWNTNAAANYFGANLGATDLPSFEVDGKSYHLGSYTGNKLMGVKPQADAKKAAVLSLLAQFLTNEECQMQRYEQFQWGPSNKNVQGSDAVQANASLAALAKQGEFGQPQGQIHGAWWDIVEVLGADAKAASSEADLKAALEAYKATIDSLFSMTEEQKQAWSVIGSICGTSWDTDFAMNKVNDNTWESDVLELKAGEEFKVRQGASWDVNFGIEFNGANIVVEADGKYIVRLVWYGEYNGTVSLIPID